MGDERRDESEKPKFGHGVFGGLALLLTSQERQ